MTLNSCNLGEVQLAVHSDGQGLSLGWGSPEVTQSIPISQPCVLELEVGSAVD